MPEDLIEDNEHWRGVGEDEEEVEFIDKYCEDIGEHNLIEKTKFFRIFIKNPKELENGIWEFSWNYSYTDNNIIVNSFDHKEKPLKTIFIIENKVLLFKEETKNELPP